MQLHLYVHSHLHAGIHASPRCFFNACALIFFDISTREDWSAQIKHEEKLSDHDV